MINEITCQATIIGENLDYRLVTFPDTINIIKSVSKGEIIDFGRNKGKISKEGFLIFDGNIDIILQFIDSELISEFLASIDQLNMSILVSYEGECNFELTVEQLAKISALKVPLGITCYNKWH